MQPVGVSTIDQEPLSPEGHQRGEVQEEKLLCRRCPGTVMALLVGGIAVDGAVRRGRTTRTAL